MKHWTRFGLLAVTVEPMSRRVTAKDPAVRLSRRFLALLATLLWCAASAAEAQEYSLFDKFSGSLEASYLGLETKARVDSKRLGIGTELSFESDLDLGSSKSIPSVTLEYRLGRRHLLSAFWQDIDRSSSSQPLTEIQFGELVIPIDSNVELGYDIKEVLLGYNYYFVLKDRKAIGVATGLRFLEISTTLTVLGLDLTQEVDVIAPVPFAGIDFRYGLSPKWRLTSTVGLFYIEIGDVKGSQSILGVTMEHLTFKNVGFGFKLRYSLVDLEVDDADYTGTVDLEINNLTFFVRARL